ncbi:MAG: hypothetical protein NVSMB6_12620 [Burkholderiaceae bacterium]
MRTRSFGGGRGCTRLGWFRRESDPSYYPVWLAGACNAAEDMRRPRPDFSAAAAGTTYRAVEEIGKRMLGLHEWSQLVEALGQNAI